MREGVSLWGWEGGDDGVRSGGRGRKLQEEGGRWETRVKISVMRRCWTEVSCWLGGGLVGGRGKENVGGGGGGVRVGFRIL